MSTDSTTTESPTAGESNQVLKIDPWKRRIDSVAMPTRAKKKNKPRASSNEIIEMTSHLLIEKVFLSKTWFTIIKTYINFFRKKYTIIFIEIKIFSRVSAFQYYNIQMSRTHFFSDIAFRKTDRRCVNISVTQVYTSITIFVFVRQGTNSPEQCHYPDVF